MHHSGADAWWKPHQNTLPPGYLEFLQHEERSIRTSCFSSIFIPGALQTEAYSRALLENLKGTILTPAECKERLAVRLKWQQSIYNRTPRPDTHFVISEAAFLGIFKSAEVHYEQCMHILELMKLPSITIQISPLHLDLSLHPTPLFWLLYDTPLCPYFLSTEGRNGHTNSTNETEINYYRLAFEHIAEKALSPQDSEAMINEIAERVRLTAIQKRQTE